MIDRARSMSDSIRALVILFICKDWEKEWGM
jgi:hypothetical protein